MTKDSGPESEGGTVPVEDEMNALLGRAQQRAGGYSEVIETILLAGRSAGLEMSYDPPRRQVTRLEDL
jgi:hypothetical protein